MKTNNKSISAIFILATIGFTNMNLVAGENKSLNNRGSVKTNQIFIKEAFLTDKDIFYSAEAFSDRDAKEEVEKYVSEQRLIVEAQVQSEFMNTAESITAEGTELEIDKYAQKQLSLLKSRSVK